MENVQRLLRSAPAGGQRNEQAVKTRYVICQSAERTLVHRARKLVPVSPGAPAREAWKRALEGLIPGPSANLEIEVNESNVWQGGEFPCPRPTGSVEVPIAFVDSEH